MFDPRITLAQVDGDRDLLKELIEIFAGQYKKNLALLEESLKKNDAPAFRLAAHTIKGSAANFRAQTAFDLARRLEEMGKTGEFSQAPAALDALVAELERLEKALREFVSKG